MRHQTRNVRDISAVIQDSTHYHVGISEMSDIRSTFGGGTGIDVDNPLNPTVPGSAGTGDGTGLTRHASLMPREKATTAAAMNHTNYMASNGNSSGSGSDSSNSRGKRVVSHRTVSVDTAGVNLTMHTNNNTTTTSGGGVQPGNGIPAFARVSYVCLCIMCVIYNKCVEYLYIYNMLYIYIYMYIYRRRRRCWMVTLYMMCNLETHLLTIAIILITTITIKV